MRPYRHLLPVVCWLLALTGLDHGPELKALLPLIGPAQAKARLAP